MKQNPAGARSLYERDFVLWLDAQAAAFREGRWSDVDAANVAEELDSLANSDRRAIHASLRLLMSQLLKRQAQPDRRVISWESTIIKQSARIVRVLKGSPSLRRELTSALREEYETARKLAAVETELPQSAFPAEPAAAFEASVLAHIEAITRARKR